MKRTVTMISLVAALVVLAAPAAFGGGHTASQMQDAGYLCITAGPADWTHCLRESKLGSPSVPVKVFTEAEFDADGVIVDGGDGFLGTELLLRADIYNGQPCSTDGGDTWDPNGVPGYFACHHFHTGHH